MYHYQGCGLPNVFLQNGYELTKSNYGSGVVIHDLEGLHDAIGQIIVSSKESLAGDEFRFLRTELELSQAMLAKLLGCDEQSVARWEKGKSKQINAPAERLLRILYQESKMGAKKMAPLLKTLQEFESTPSSPKRIIARERAETWSVKAQAA